MNTIERRISDQLRAYGEGLDMTTRDIDRLEHELEQKQHVARAGHRNKVWQIAVAACAVTGVVLGTLALRNDTEPPKVPASPPPLTLTELAGTWRVNADETPWLWTFTEDGRMVAWDQPDTLPRPDAPGWTITPVPGGFKSVDQNEGGPCYLTWAATISAEGRMQATVTEAAGDCGIAAGDTWAWTRISPLSLASATMRSNWPSSDKSMVNQVAQLRGTWLLRGTSTVLAVEESGDVVLRDLSTRGNDHSSTLTLNKDGSIAFAGPNGSGCSLAYGSMTTHNSTVVAEQPRSTGCGLPDEPSHTWIRLN